MIISDFQIFKLKHSSSELDWMIMGPFVIEIENIWQIIKIDFEAFIENN